jgi:hypothetical protein
MNNFVFHYSIKIEIFVGINSISNFEKELPKNKFYLQSIDFLKEIKNLGF